MSGLPMKTQRVFCTFRLDGHLYGVDVLDVKEVTTATTATPISHAPDEVMGLVNIRGQIYLALDLRRLLGWASVDGLQFRRDVTGFGEVHE